MGNSPSKPNYGEIHKNADRQGICKGCNKIEALLRYQTAHPGPLQPLKFHESFKDLDECARACVACRTFRQALLLKQLTYEDAKNLEGSKQEIFATTTGSMLRISSGRTDNPSESTLLTLMHRQEVTHVARPKSPCDTTIYHQVRNWLGDCKELHRAECGNLGWSQRRPTRLIHILSESRLQLVYSQAFIDATGLTYDEMEYVALSYQWGPKQEGKITDHRTIDTNVRDRCNSFDISELPNTIQDAVLFTKRVGLNFVWVDAICIIQDSTDFAQEAPRMHEVYGNAAFTICAASNENAADPLFDSREAWTYPTEPVRLNGQWIANLDGSLDEMRKRSPLASRAWTLQEEFLSPRILYWFGQRMYWSCARSQHMEANVISRSGVPITQQFTQGHQRQNSPQQFLTCCWRGDPNLHHEWLTIVASYVRRDLTNTSDRFGALSGVASRYLRAQMSGADHNNAYLAGLWINTFAQDLAWTVVQDRPEMGHLQQHAPTWSWASLPLRTEISHLHEGYFVDRSRFQLLRTNFRPRLEAQSEKPPRYTEEEPPKPVEAIIEAGSNVESVEVCGRFRPFALQHSRWRHWAEIQEGELHQQRFHFDRPDEATHSSNLLTRRILCYEPGKEAVVGQLDYMYNAKRVDIEELYCLEIAKSFMLILQPAGSKAEGTRWRRIGLSGNYRSNFFAGYRVETLVLV